MIAFTFHWPSANAQSKLFFLLFSQALCAIFIALSCSGTYFHPSSHWSVVFPSLGWLCGPWVFAPLVLEALQWRGCYVAIKDISRVCLRKKGLWIELISSRVTLTKMSKWTQRWFKNAPQKALPAKKKKKDIIVTFIFIRSCFTLFQFRSS